MASCAGFIPADGSARRLGQIGICTSAMLIAWSMVCGHAIAQSAFAIERGHRADSTITLGGLRNTARIVAVTTRADSGTGSLRDALGQSGPRVIVFDVGGVIELESPLVVSEPYVTIAGQTAPNPGITLLGDTLKIRASDVVVQHIAVRTGSSPIRALNSVRDGISIGGSTKHGAGISRVRMEHVSISWAVDENLSIWGAKTRDISIMHGLIAEALRNGGHPKGRHSMGIIVASGPQNVVIRNTLLASNDRRNPRISSATSVVFANNAIYNPGHRAIHLHVNCGEWQGRSEVGPNAVIPGPDTIRGIIHFEKLSRRNKKGRYTSRASCPSAYRHVKRAPDLWPNARKAMIRRVIKFGGSRPAKRDFIDARIVNGAQLRTGRIVDLKDIEERLKTLRNVQPTSRSWIIPDNPFEFDHVRGVFNIQAVICRQHFEVGGANTLTCPRHLRQATSRGG